MKKMRRDMNLHEDFISGVDLAEWLEKNERLCQRVGDLTERIKLEKVIVLAKIKDFRQEEILLDLSNWLSRVEGTVLSKQVVTQVPEVVSTAVNNKTRKEASKKKLRFDIGVGVGSTSTLHKQRYYK